MAIKFSFHISTPFLGKCILILYDLFFFPFGIPRRLIHYIFIDRVNNIISTKNKQNYNEVINLFSDDDSPNKFNLHKNVANSNIKNKNNFTFNDDGENETSETHHSTSPRDSPTANTTSTSTPSTIMYDDVISADLDVDQFFKTD